MKPKQTAINLFINKTNYDKTQIVSCTPIHKGFTNLSYKIRTQSGDAYQVRIANDGHQVDRHNEQIVYQLIKFSYFVYYDVTTGNAIKKWIKGSNPDKKTICSSQFLQSFSTSLKALHSIKNDNVLTHQYFDCIEKAKLPSKHRTAYLQLIKKYLNMPLVLSHNDLSADNLLYTKDHKVVFIDYEWARLNNEYWDVANFIREVDLPLTKIKLLCKYMDITKIKDLLIFVYLATNYAYQWTFNMPQTTKIKTYRQITFKKMEKYYRFIQSS